MNAENMIRRGASGAMFGVGIMMFGIAFIALPLVLTMVPGLGLKGPTVLTLVGFGTLVLAVGAILSAYARLYHKASPDVAYVRTGRGGAKIVIDGGLFVVPFMHELQPVYVGTMRLEVARHGATALITGDKLRSDVTAQFFVKIQKTAENIRTAADSLGAKCSDQNAIKEQIESKLESALRDVAATKTLEELNSNRETFAKAVHDTLANTLAHNGLSLESVAISKLDQTPPGSMRPQENVFDAVGVTTITQKTQAAAVERTKIETEAAQQITQRNVENRKRILELELDQKRAEATTESSKQMAAAEAEAKAQAFAAEQQRTAAEAAAEAQRKINLAQVAQEQATSLANVEKERQVAVATQQKQQAEKTAEIERTKTTELLTREQQIAVADAEKRRAEAAAKQLEAEKARKAAEQAVQTVEVTASAERDAAKAIITKKAAVEQTVIEEQAKANVQAYTQVKTAEGKQEAAIKEAEAILKRAEAERSAAVLKAEGAKAEALIPVQVAAQQVEVENKRVDVLTRELKAKSENQQVSIELQVQLAKIEADRAAKVEMAKALGQALGAAKIQMWSDPMALAKMVNSWNSGMSAGLVLQGANEVTPTGVKDSLTELFEALSTRLAGKAPTLENLQAILPSLIPLLPKSDAGTTQQQS